MKQKEQKKKKKKKEYLRRTKKGQKKKCTPEEKKNFSKPSSAAEISLKKKINNWVFPLVRFSGPILKGTGEKLKHMVRFLCLIAYQPLWVF